jgi:capsule polysaccharide modification protein KpsS
MLEDFRPEDFAKILGILLGALMVLYAFGKAMIGLYFKVKEKFEDQRQSRIEEWLKRLEKMIVEVESKAVKFQAAIDSRLINTNGLLQERVEEVKKFHYAYISEVKVLEEQIKAVAIQNSIHYREVMTTVRDFVKRSDERFKVAEAKIEDHGRVLYAHDGILEPFKRKKPR